VLIWVPLRFGSPEYEFTSVAASLDGLPLTLFGMTFALAASRASGRVKSAKAVIVLLLVVTLFVVAGGVLYWLNVPLALNALRNQPVPRMGIHKSMVKVTAQVLFYSAAMLTFARMATRKSETQAHGERNGVR
jgi:fucose 4-O-acetylase-like acetyltransferase